LYTTSRLIAAMLMAYGAISVTTVSAKQKLLSGCAVMFLFVALFDLTVSLSLFATLVLTINAAPINKYGTVYFMF